MLFKQVFNCKNVLTLVLKKLYSNTRLTSENVYSLSKRVEASTTATKIAHEQSRANSPKVTAQYH